MQERSCLIVIGGSLTREGDRLVEDDGCPIGDEHCLIRDDRCATRDAGRLRAQYRMPMYQRSVCAMDVLSVPPAGMLFV